MCDTCSQGTQPSGDPNWVETEILKFLKSTHSRQNISYLGVNKIYALAGIYTLP